MIVRWPGLAGELRDVAGLNGAELRRQVPGIDYFPFEAGAQEATKGVGLRG